jgi:hypothetical protein
MITKIQARSNGCLRKTFINDDGGDISLSSGAIYINGTHQTNRFWHIIAFSAVHINTGSDVTLTGGGYVITGATSGN